MRLLKSFVAESNFITKGTHAVNAFVIKIILYFIARGESPEIRSQNKGRLLNGLGMVGTKGGIDATRTSYPLL
jgi:hypothetical protein